MEFEWDGGNLLKSLAKHGINREQSEQVFLSRYVLEIDESHSSGEIRFKLVGKAGPGKILYIVFTTRANKIRIISARTADKRERDLYEEKTQENTKI